MCGIVGGYNRTGAGFGEHMARAACDVIVHRGPNDFGAYEADGMLIANRRLSILDIVGGHQPMFSDDGQIAVVQNGEIYNYLEISKGLHCKTHCDTEVILRLYEKEGPDFLKKLNGMFAIAILDRRKHQLLLARDPTGQKPLYLHDDGKRLLFASEIKALLTTGISREVDWEALDAYLTYNFVPAPKTIFKGIRQLQPGSALIIDPKGLREWTWWQLAANAPQERTTEQWGDEINAVIKEATRICLRSDVPFGAFLSGGLDSSTVVGYMSQLCPQPVETFTIGFPDKRFDESPFAQEVADLFHTHHTTEIVEPDMVHLWPLTTYHCDQPHGDVSFMPMYRVSELAKRNVTVVLTGDGGDELFAGYKVHQGFFNQQDLQAPRDQLERGYVKAISLYLPEQKHRIYSERLRTELGAADADRFALEILGQYRHLDPINQAMALDVKLLLPGNNLIKPDRMAMAVSLETRAPFLDTNMLDLAFRIPGWLKFRENETKWIYKKAVERLLPKDIIYRSKQMFTVPIGDWFKDRLYGFARNVLLDRRTADRGLFKTAEVDAMIDEHRDGKANHTRHLRALISLELWMRTFIDGNFNRVPTFADLGIQFAGTSKQ